MRDIGKEIPCGYTCMRKEQRKQEEIPCGYTCMRKEQRIKEEISCGYTCMRKEQRIKEEIPCGYTCMRKEQRIKEEIPCGYTCMRKEQRIEEEIAKKLDEIERTEGVRILHAVESGSRAWGFASPDSDYDVRFVYVRPQEDYLRIDERRDVIEWQLDEVLDINGWDLKKALRQFAKGNATLFEWSGSPIVYRTTADWEKIREISKQYFSEKAAVYHYYGTANSTLQGYLQGEKVRYKKYFYALRPLLAARYIETHHVVPPVRFSDLLSADISSELRAAIDALLEMKKNTTEGEAHTQIPVIRAFIEEETERQKALADRLADDRNRDFTALNRIFREIVSAEG